MPNSVLCLPYRLLCFIGLHVALTTGALHASVLQTQLTQGGIYRSQVEPGIWRVAFPCTSRVSRK